jgi:hypothetical protein
LGHFFHERSELIVYASKFVELSGQHRLDICTSKEDALEIHISSLYVNPIVEDYSDFLELFVPRHNLFLEDFVIWGHPHGGDVVDVFIDLGKEILPSFDESAFALIPDQFELILCPAILDASDELLQDHFSSCLAQDFSHHLLILHEIRLPKVVESEVIEFHLDF